jgi:hypothetical protein
MNAELSAMNTISRTFERVLDTLDTAARERVLNWFLSWAMAQRTAAIHSASAPTVPTVPGTIELVPSLDETPPEPAKTPKPRVSS